MSSAVNSAYILSASHTEKLAELVILNQYSRPRFYYNVDGYTCQALAEEASKSVDFGRFVGIAVASAEALITAKCFIHFAF